MHMDMLAADADRERTIDVLKAGFAEGRLTQDEYTDKVTRGLMARTYRDLHALIADLPHGAAAAVPAAPPAVGRPSGPRLRVWLGVLAALVLALMIGGLVPLTSPSGQGTTSVVPAPAAAVPAGNG
jgi:hypothetical protein